MAQIEVKNLTRSFGEGESKTLALRDVSFEIIEGEFVSIMGASGSGKSTMMHILGLLDKPTGGEYRLNDEDVLSVSDERSAQLRNSEIGFVFQTFHLLPRVSALANVMIPLSYSAVPASQHEEKARKVLEQVGLGHRLEHEPSQLSGGERQRVAIARALINDPKIVFADEPTGNLDSKMGNQIMDLVAELNQQGRTVIVVTHEQETADYTNRIITLKDGQIISDN